MPKKNLEIKVHATSIIRNITNFFSKELAFVQELLQNCRRAEASEVSVTLDHRNKSITIEDNGQGVYDPESLITIGKSDWATKINQEMPAGMGLFSAFKVCPIVVIRSGSWALTIDFTKRTKKDAVVLENMLPKVRGTTVTLRDLKEKPTLREISEEFFSEAIHMPFKTQIITTEMVAGGEKTDVLEMAAFDPSRYTPLAFVKRPWGTVYYVETTRENYLIDGVAREKHTNEFPRGRFISQGIGLSFRKLFPEGKSGSLPEHFSRVFVVADAGVLDFTLPDRDAILHNDKSIAFNVDLMAALHDLLLEVVCLGREIADDILDECAESFASMFADEREKLPERYRGIFVKESYSSHYRPLRLLDKKENTIIYPKPLDVLEGLFDRDWVFPSNEKEYETALRNVRDAKCFRYDHVVLQPDVRGDRLYHLVGLKTSSGEIFKFPEGRALYAMGGEDDLHYSEDDKDLIIQTAEVRAKDETFFNDDDENPVVIHTYGQEPINTQDASSQMFNEYVVFSKHEADNTDKVFWDTCEAAIQVAGTRTMISGHLKNHGLMAILSNMAPAGMHLLRIINMECLLRSTDEAYIQSMEAVYASDVTKKTITFVRKPDDLAYIIPVVGKLFSGDDKIKEVFDLKKPDEKEKFFQKYRTVQEIAVKTG